MKDKTDICSAIEEAGAVEVASSEETYTFAKLDENGCLVWYDKKTKEETGSVVTLAAIRKDIWRPYHEVKEIRPEQAGELWQRGINKYITFGNSRNLRMFKQDGGEYYLDEFIPSGPVHGQGGWKRLVPKVEDDSVERIEIEDMFIKGVECESQRFPNKKISILTFISSEVSSEILNKIRANNNAMEMTLKFQKI